MAEAVIEAHGLRLAFPGGRLLFDGLGLSIPEGRITALIGPNGSGKSTLISVLTGLLRPEGGCVDLRGKPLPDHAPRALARLVGLLPQSPEAVEGLRVRELVALGRAPHRGFLSPWRAEDEAACQAALCAAALEDLADAALTTLSGGQRQRAFIAMVLAQGPEILFLDEPTTFLDIAHQMGVLRILKDLNARNGTTVIAAIHDIAQAAQLADHVIVLSEGRLHAAGPPQEILTPGLLRDVFGVEARVYPDAVTGQLVVLPTGLAGERP